MRFSVSTTWSDVRMSSTDISQSSSFRRGTILLGGPTHRRLISGVPMVAIFCSPSPDPSLSPLAAAGDVVDVPACRCPSPRQSTLFSGRTRHVTVTGLTATWNCDVVPLAAAITWGGRPIVVCSRCVVIFWWTFGVMWPGGFVLVDDDEVGQLDDVWLSLSSTSTATVRENIALRSVDDFTSMEHSLLPFTGRVGGDSISNPRLSSRLLTNWPATGAAVCSNRQPITYLSTVATIHSSQHCHKEML